jgi:hypothetical protein
MVSVRLTEEELTKAREVGDGNASEGLRRALIRYKLRRV